MHKPILLQDLGLVFPHKTCFENFNATILPGSRMAIIGRNGSGKSSLLSMLSGQLPPTEGSIVASQDMQVAYVPQQIAGNLSGGERFWQALNAALSLMPDVLLLDEPTNHLDECHRQALWQVLHHFDGTLLVVSHDVELLRNCVTVFWHIDSPHIHVFHGNYEDYRQATAFKQRALTQEKNRLQQRHKGLHHSLMQEQQRAAKSRQKGEKNIANRKWATINSVTKAARGNTTAANKKSELRDRKQDVSEQLAQLQVPEVITPKFTLNSSGVKNRCLVAIEAGSVAYGWDKPVLSDIYWELYSQDRVALLGHNGSGKSTLIKALLSDASVMTSGQWFSPPLSDIGYLDQHYADLIDTDSVLESIQKVVPTWSMLAVRRHLTDFLFFNNEEVQARVAVLSGGEKARLCLAKIAAVTPTLLILDEVTNNLDLDSREHVIQVLKAYPGALLVISHDTDFLSAIGVQDVYRLADGAMCYEKKGGACL